MAGGRCCRYGGFPSMRVEAMGIDGCGTLLAATGRPGCV